MVQSLLTTEIHDDTPLMEIEQRYRQLQEQIRAQTSSTGSLNWQERSALSALEHSLQCHLICDALQQRQEVDYQVLLNCLWQNNYQIQVYSQRYPELWENVAKFMIQQIVDHFSCDGNMWFDDILVGIISATNTQFERSLWYVELDTEVGEGDLAPRHIRALWSFIRVLLDRASSEHTSETLTA